MKKIKLFTLLAAVVCATSMQAWTGSGTSADPYLIANATDWNTLATNVSGGNTYNGTYFKLTGDITVSEMVGTDGNRFAGTFNGNGHTLTFNKGTAGSRFSEQHCGPFRYISGATIKCLHIAGTIYTSNQFAGVVGRTGGTNHFIACRSSLTIDCSKSGDGTNGGFIGVVEGTRTYFTNCLFDGQLLGSSSHSNGGFCGWSQNGVTLTNCLFAPSSVTFSATSSKTFSRGNNVSDSNCYYKQLYGDAQGTNAGSMSNEELQEALGIGWEISGGKVVPIISLRAMTGEGTEASPYLIGSATDWDNLAVNVALGETYSGKFFKLINNITVSEMVGTDQNNHFAGTFDGDGYTLTFNKGTADSRFAENYCAPFRYTRGASLKNLIVAGTIYTSAQFAAVLGNAHGDTYINNCRSSIVINSSISGDGTHGGFIGVTDDGHNHFTNCVFNGKMVGSGTNSCGGFVGWTDAIYGSSTSEFTNCLFAPAELTIGSSGSATFSRGRNDNTANITCTNCYYASSFGTAQGTAVGSKTNTELASALGSVWIVQDSKVVPVLYYHFTGEGTEGNPYLIATATDWQGIATNIKFYSENYDAKYFLQTADFSTTEMVGVCSGGSITKPFCGTYDGDSHTLIVNLPTATDDDAGPFRGIQGATIKNLHTAGTVDGGTFGYAGGIAGRAIGNSTIINCRSSVTVTASKNGDGSHGGLVGNSTGTTIEGCIFDGRLITTNNTYNCGGLVGWSQGGTIIRNCLFAPTEFTASMATNWSATFGRDGGNSGANYTITNSYYTQTFGKAQGKQTYSVTGAAGVTVANAGTATVYNVSGITSYGTGIKYNNVLYGGNGDNLSLAISGSTGYKPSAGTLTGADPYTLTMADANTIIYPAASCTAPTAINPTYTGVAQALVNAGTVTGGTMYYSLDNSAWDAAIPTGTAAGDYTVYYKVIGDATHADYTPSPNTIAATIAKAPLTITADEKWIDYGDELMYMVATYTGFVNGEDAGVVSPAVHFSSDYTQGDNAGTYTITPYGAGAANYEISYQTGVLHVNKVAPTITATPTAIDGLVANGSAQTLINAGEATGGEMQYSLNNLSWSTELPTGTDANTYTVYYKVVGDINHTHISATSFEVTIAAPAAVIGDPNTAEEITAFLDYYDGQNVAALTIVRPVLNNMYNTLCLPFDMDEDQIAASSLNGIEIYELEDVSVVNDELYLYTGAQKNAIVAGRPYLVKFSAASQLEQLTFADVIVNNANLTEEAVTIKGVTFTGTFQPVVLGAQTELDFNGGHLFLAADNTLLWPNTNSALKPFRAYFTVNVDAGQAAGMPMRRGMPAHIGQPAQMPTGVESIQPSAVSSQKVMIDGVLYIIRGEHMYDAQGQMVK